jgi:hypothetical protein
MCPPRLACSLFSLVPKAMVVSGGRVCEVIEVRSAVHLPFDHLDAVDVAFYRSRVVAQSESIVDAP